MKDGHLISLKLLYDVPHEDAKSISKRFTTAILRPGVTSTRLKK